MRVSAGLLIYRKSPELEVFLVHPGGPFWARKNAWGIPKGEYEDNEDPLEAAKREFKEETGLEAPEGKYLELGEIKTSGKKILAWAVMGNPDPATISSNTMVIEWPPKSGQKQEFPEVDKAAWLSLAEAAPLMHKGQEEFLSRLAGLLGYEAEPAQPTQSSLF
jgi:predicted NUDIX family NTP pyrophosphohydrolase